MWQPYTTLLGDESYAYESGASLSVLVTMAIATEADARLVRAGVASETEVVVIVVPGTSVVEASEIG